MLTTPTPDDNYARRTNRDYIGSFGRIPNEPKTVLLTFNMFKWCSPISDRSQVQKEICKNIHHKSSPAEFSTSQYLLNSVLLIVALKFSTSLQIQHLGMSLHFST